MGVSILQRMQSSMKKIMSHMISKPRRKRSVNLAKNSVKSKERQLKSQKVLQSRSLVKLPGKSERILRRLSMIRSMKQRKRRSKRNLRLKRKS